MTFVPSLSPSLQEVPIVRVCPVKGLTATTSGEGGRSTPRRSKAVRPAIESP